MFTLNGEPSCMHAGTGARVTPLDQFIVHSVATRDRDLSMVAESVIGDNRTTMHRVRHYCDLQEVRDLRRTSIKGGGEQISSAFAAEQRSHRMSVTITDLTPGFVGEVSGIDITQPLTRPQVATLEAGMDRYGVLVYHDQRLTDDQQKAFSLNFGPLEQTAGGNVTKAADRRLDPDMADVSNLGADHKPLARDDRRRLFNLGNQLWHSDSSFRAVPAKYSLLSGRIVVEAGGDTEFADMRASYDALDDATKAKVEDLVCEHSLTYSRGTLGFTDLSDEERRMFRPVRQRLVRTHPVTGRKSLYLSSHIGTIVGWPVPEARAFIRDLTEHATQPRFTYAHKWRQFDLVVWDNRVTMHRVRRFDETRVRDMRRTTVAGDAATAEQMGA